MRNNHRHEWATHVTLHTHVPAAALQEGAGQTLGWLTTNSRKETMCFQLREALRIGNLAFSSQFFSTASTAGEAKLQLDDELVRCSVSTIRMQNQIMNVCVSPAAKFLRSSRASTDTVRKGKEDLFWKGRRSPRRPQHRTTAGYNRSTCILSE